MSLLNGTVEATHSKVFSTYKEASDFVSEIGVNNFEGFQIREDSYIVNYFG